MNLEKFFLELQELQNEIGQLIDDGNGELYWIWSNCDMLLVELEKIINVGKHGGTR
jgi:hypothetical protein